MILPGSLFFWLLQCTLWLLGNTDKAHHVRGIPGIDYPNYESIPQTSFLCSEQLHIPGLYADPETGCQMFHHCYEHRHESFLCPPGTIFNQAILVCDYWYSAECSETTWPNRDDSPQKVISFDHETTFVPKKNPSLNIFDKMASLYEVKEPAPTSSKKYRSNVDTLEESKHFRDGHILGIHTNKIENQKYANSYLDVANLHDRREGVLFESPDEYSSNQENNNENDHRIFKDSFTDFESSGESDYLDEHVFTADDLLLLNNTENHVDIEEQYFGYNESNHSEHHTKHSNRVSNDEDMLTNSYTDLADKKENSSKLDFESRDKFIRRQSENIENPNDRRKTKRRKPIFIIKSEKELEHITTEKIQDKSKINSNNLVDYPTFSLKESVPEFKPLITPAPSRTKRRKPILIDLEDLPQYNVDNGKNVPGGTRTSSINYEVNLKTNMPDFPIAAEEISVKLFPNKRKPINGYLLDTTEKYNVESGKNIELSSLKNLASLSSNMYDTPSTLSTLKNIEKFEDVSMNFGMVYPKRKKNIIHIIDSEDDHNVYLENKKPMDTTIYTSEIEDEITTQSLNENFEGFNKFSEPNMNYHDDEIEHEIKSDSVEVDTEQYENSYNFIPPYTHIEEGDHNVYENKELMTATTYTTEFEDEITTQSLNENFEKKFEPNMNYHDDGKEHESGSVEVDTKQYEDSYNFIPPYTHIEEGDHNVYENKELMTATTYTTEFEDEITTQSLNENFEVFDKFSEPNMNYHDDEKEHEIELESIEVVTEQFEDSYNFIPPFTRIEVSDGADGTYFTEINPEVVFNINKFEGDNALEDEVNSINPKNFQDFEVNKHEKMHDSPYVTTEFPLSKISTRMPHEIQYDEETTSQMYFIPNTVQSTFDNLGTTESILNSFPKTFDKNHDVRESLMNNFESNPSYQTSIDYELLDNSNIKHAVTEYFHFENDDLHNLLKQLPSYTYETNKEINLSQNSDFEESNLSYEDKIFNKNTSQNITHVESAISRKEIEEFDPLLDAKLQGYLSNENSNLKNELNFDLTKDIYTEPSVSFVEDSSSENSLDEQFHSYHPIFDANALEAQDSIENEQELIYQTIPPKFEPDHNAYLSDDPIKMNTLEKINQENVKNNDDEFAETSYLEASSIDVDDSRTESLDELESDYATTSVYALFETENIPSYLQENSFNPKPNINSKTMAKDAPEIGIHKVASSTEANMLNKGHFKLKQNIPGTIKTDTIIKTAKGEPVRKPRAFISPHQIENMLFETFGSQNFANLPYSMLKLKQSGMRNVLPESIHRFDLEGLTYSTRTGNLLQSPKISKLISFGKNLLRSKKAKLRILGRYVNSFQTNQ